jgi:hypothetical protein
LVNSIIFNGVNEIGKQELADAVGGEGGHIYVTTLNLPAGKRGLRVESMEKTWCCDGDCVVNMWCVRGLRWVKRGSGVVD